MGHVRAINQKVFLKRHNRTVGDVDPLGNVLLWKAHDKL